MPGWRQKVAHFFATDLTAEQIAGPTAAQWRTDERTKTLLETLVRLTQKKYNLAQLPADLEARLAQYSQEQLARLIDNIALSATLEEWLATFPPV